MKKVYICFGTDIIHTGHIAILNKAANLGEVTVGVLTDEVIASYKRFPIIPFDERAEVIKNIACVKEVILQDTLDYEKNLKLLKPDYVVHGDEWINSNLSYIREKVIDILKEQGGELIEFPYTKNDTIDKIEQYAKEKLYMPEYRRARLRYILSLKKTISVIETHSGLTGLIAENTKVIDRERISEFDAMWVSSLCDSTVKGKPDIELVDMSSRLRTIEEIMDVTTKPIILDGDTGGLVEHFEFNVRTLERMGISAIIIEDKIGIKKNSLFGNEVIQHQDTIEGFCSKIKAGKKALRTKDFMIIARIESLILEKPMEDALNRARAYVKAGADGIMIHSRKSEPNEIFEFCKIFRNLDKKTPLVVVPTTFDKVTELEWEEKEVNIVIYANHLTRSAFPAMQKVAEEILIHHRAFEVQESCMPIKQILNLIPEKR